MKSLKKALLFVLALACFWSVCFGISLTLGTPVKKGIKKFPDNSLEYLVFGDSEAYASFSPLLVYREAGYTGYNLGIALNHIQDACYDFNEVLQTQTPKTIFVETNFLFRNRDTLKTSMKYFDRKAPDFMPLLDNHDNWKNVFKKRSKPKISTLETMRGFVLNASVSPWSNTSSKSETAKQKTIPLTSLKFLEQLVASAQEKNINIIFYAAPSPINWTQEHYQEVKDFADKAAIPYYDFNKNPDWVPIDWNTDTFDKGDHLNLAGAQKVTRFFIDLMQKNNLYTDQRLNPDSEEWNSALAHYNQVTGFK